MHDTEFPASKIRRRRYLSHANGIANIFLRVSSWIVLILSLCVCSCVKPSRTISTSADSPPPLAINATPQASRININTASARDLDALPGLGKVLAERILAHRMQYGPFRRAEHLMMVRGFSDNKFRAIRERVTVE